MPSATAFLNEPDAPSASAFLEEEPTPTSTPTAVAEAGDEDGFLTKINAVLRKPSPEWLQAPEQAARELVGGMVPHDLPSYLKSLYPPAMAYEQAKGLAEGDVSSIPFVGRVPEIIEAEQTPAASKERYLAAMKTLMDVGLLTGAAAERPLSRIRTEPIVPLERPPIEAEAPPVQMPLVEPPPMQAPLADLIRQQSPEAALAERITQPQVAPEVPPEVAPSAPEVGAEVPAGYVRFPDGKIIKVRDEAGNLTDEYKSASAAEVLKATGEQGALAPPPPAAVPAVAEAPLPYTPEATAARAAEPPPSAPPEVTSTKNVVTAAEREARGFAPAEQAAARDFGTVWDEAGADPAAPTRLVASLKLEPRALRDVENAYLLRRQIELQNEHDAMTRAVNEATDPVALTEAKGRLETVRNELQDVYDVGKIAGTETGRGLNARKMLADQNYTLANMEATTRAIVNDGKPLSEAQAGEVAKLHERIRAAEDRLSAYEAMDIFNKSLKEQPRRPVLSFLDEQAVRARERINARKNRLYADPLGVTNVAHLADEAIIGASHIARGLTKFADWSAQMVSEFGERIKPFLRALFEKSREQYKTASSKLKAAPLSYVEREARALAGEKKGIVTRTEKLKARAAVIETGHPYGEFEPLGRKAPRMDAEKARLQFEYQKAKEAYDRGLLDVKLARQSGLEKTARYTGEAMRTVRSIKTAYDISGVLRQGGFNYFGHPIEGTRALKSMVEAAKSEEGQFRIMQEIRDDPLYSKAKQAGVFFSDIDTPNLSKMEEVYASRFARKIPGVGASERAYSTYLNKIRMDRFRAMSKTLTKSGEATPAEAKIIGNFINVTSGRGNMGRLSSGAETLNSFFFAPRYVLSRFQTLLGQPLWHRAGQGSLRVRAAIAKEYGRTLAGIGLVLGTAASAGLGTIELDPRSTDFLALKSGNKRRDFLFGIRQIATFLSRLATQQTKTQSGEIRSLTGDVPYGQDRVSDVIWRFLLGKAGPIPGAAIAGVSGQKVTGQPTSLIQEGLQLALPISTSDVSSAMQANGVPEKLIDSLLAVSGVGIQNYGPRDTKTRSAERRRLEARDLALMQGDIATATRLTLEMTH
jgi:hypothetical protein